MISFIVPFFNKYELVHKRLAEFWTLVSNDFEIVLINDASTDTGFEGNINWWQNTVTPNLPLRYHKNEKNLGFVGSMNLGGRNARGDLLVFFSNDVEIRGNFIPELNQAIMEHPNALIGNRLVNFDGGWNGFEYKEERVFVPYLEGWFIACVKPIWEKLGGFDPIYAPSDMEDVDLSTTAKYMGIPIIPLNCTKLYHLGAQSYGFNPTREARTKANREKWLSKWADKWDDIFGV